MSFSTVRTEKIYTNYAGKITRLINLLRSKITEFLQTDPKKVKKNAEKNTSLGTAGYMRTRQILHFFQLKWYTMRDKCLFCWTAPIFPSISMDKLFVCFAMSCTLSWTVTENFLEIILPEWALYVLVRAKPTTENETKEQSTPTSTLSRRFTDTP